MASFLEFDKETKQNWLKGVQALFCLQTLLERFIDDQIGIFHQKLRDECSANMCEKNCNFNNWKPRQNQPPPFDCEVCSSWRDVILANHTNQRGKVMWMNSKPNRWFQDKWEVAKVYMPDGHKNHDSIGDFDIAAHLGLMKQCKHFDKFELGGLCDKVANVRNTIMHSANFELEREDLLDYFNRIKTLGEVLGKHVPDFKSLSEDIDEIRILDFRLVTQNSQAQDGKRLEDILLGSSRKRNHRKSLLQTDARTNAHRRQDSQEAMSSSFSPEFPPHMKKGLMATSRAGFFKTLEELRAEEFKRFKWFLQQEEVLKGFEAIPQSRLEFTDRMDTVELMVTKYTINTFKVIRIVLELIERNDLVAKFPKNI